MTIAKEIKTIQNKERKKEKNLQHIYRKKRKTNNRQKNRKKRFNISKIYKKRKKNN